MRLITYAITGAAMLSAIPAQAAVYVLSASGTVNRMVQAVDGTFPPAPTGKFAVGDNFSVKMHFDSDKAEVASLFDADPTINIYFLPGATFDISAGTYRSTFGSRFSTSSSVQLWNDYAVSPSRLTDSQTFSGSNYDFQGDKPFDLGGGLNFETISINAFDYSALVRQSDSISELNSSSAQFGTNLMSYTYSTGDVPGTNAIRPLVLVDISNVTWSLNAVSPVPEPATWMMMLIGFGMVGASVRYRSRKPRVTFQTV